MGFGDFWHEDNRWGRCIFVELGRVRIFQSQNIATEFDSSSLQSKADAEVWYVVGAGVVRGGDLAFDSADAESTGDEDPVSCLEQFPCFILLL